MPEDLDIPKSLLDQVLEEMFVKLEKEEKIEDQVMNELRQLAANNQFTNRKKILSAITWLPEVES